MTALAGSNIPMEKVAAGTLLRQFLEKWTVTKEEFDLGHMIVHPNNLRLSHLDKVVKKGLSLKRCECIGIGIGSDGCYSVLCVLFGLLAYVGVKILNNKGLLLLLIMMDHVTIQTPDRLNMSNEVLVGLSFVYINKSLYSIQ